MPKITALPIANSAATGDLLVLDQGNVTKRIDFNVLQSAVANAGTVQSIVSNSLTSALGGPLVSGELVFGSPTNTLGQSSSLSWDDVAKILTLVSAGGGVVILGGQTSRMVQIAGVLTGVADAIGLGITTTFTPVPNAPAVGIASEPTFTRSASGSHPVFASIWARKPVVNGGAATIGTLCSLYVTAGNTEGITNYAIFSEEGINRFGSAGATDQSVFGGPAPVANQTMTAYVESNTNQNAPRGMFINSIANNSGEVCGVVFGFNGGQYSAGVEAIQTDTGQQSADLGFFNRTSVGGGATAVRWRIKGAADPGHFLAESDNAYDIGSGIGRPRNINIGGVMKIGASGGYHTSDNTPGMTSSINIGAKTLVIKDGIVTGFA